MKKGDVIRQKCVNNTFYVTGIWAHKVNNRDYKRPSSPGNLAKFSLYISKRDSMYH